MKPLMKDPADLTAQDRQADSDKELENALDLSNYKMSDFKAATLKDARQSHPFDGYPDKKAQVGTYIDPKTRKEQPLIVNLTHILVYKEEVKQDPSGKVVSLGYPEMRNNDGKVIRPNTERTGSIATAHNRRAKDYESGGIDIDCVFDRTLILADGEIKQACFISSPSVRSQIVFRYNSKTQRVEHDPRYLMADPKQVARLRDVFDYIIEPRKRREKAIRRTFDEGGDTYSSQSLPGIPEGE